MTYSNYHMPYERKTSSSSPNTKIYVRRDKFRTLRERNKINDKGSVQEEDVTIVNI